MLRSLTVKQLQGWQLFAELEPFGDERQDLRMANVMQLMANLQRDPKTKPQPYKLSDFILKFEELEEAEPAKPWQTLKHIARQWAALYNEGR